MRFTTLSILAALSALGTAQNLLDQLPKCAQACYDDNRGQCNAIDIKCVCQNTTLIDGLSCCVAETCNTQEQETTIKFAADLCGANGVEVPTSAACSASNPTPTPSADPSPAGTTGTSSSTAGAAMHTGIGIGLGLGMAGLLAAL